MIFETPELHEAELAVVDRIEDIKRKIGHSVGTPKRWFGVLRRATFARAIRGSNTIEGIEVSPDDAIAAVEGEEPLDAKREAWEAIKGYRTAMTYVLQLADSSDFAYSGDLIRSLHFMMLQYDLAKRPGKWRRGAVRVHDEEKHEDVYEGPPPDAVPELIEALLKSLNASERVPGIVRAAMGHLNLVMIHPFSDGNGRMSRCLHTLILARTGILAPVFSSIEEWLGKHTREYYDVLLATGGSTWTPGNDALPWVRFCLRAHFQQARTLERRIQEMEALWNLLEQEIKRRKLPERVIFALSDAAFRYRIRNATYRPVAEVTNQIASRDLKLLTEEGFLIPEGERRGRVYVASPDLLALRDGVRLPKSVEDPFERSERPPTLPGLGL